jgi:hypothetical protein
MCPFYLTKKEGRKEGRRKTNSHDAAAAGAAALAS